MTEIFVVCAAVGSTVLVLQFLLALMGLGGESFGFDGSHDFGHDAGGGDHDISSHESPAHEHSDSHVSAHHAHGPVARGTTSLFRALSLRTVAAALAFFGLAGLAAHSADCSSSTTLAIALASGFAALYAVYYMLTAMKSLRAEGTVRIDRAVGAEATVYLRIPGNRQGAGKIQVNVQNRTMEYLAITLGDPIPTGATVVVAEVLASDTVRVEPVIAA